MTDIAKKTPTFGKDLGNHLIDPYKIKFADDIITSNKPFRNPRSNLDATEMGNKRESIRTLGILKPPIVRPIANDPDGYTHQMVAGSLRLRSVLKLIDDDAECYNPETCEFELASVLYKTLKCNVRECDEETAIRISIAENLEHTQVPELDLMEYCQELVNLRNGDNPKYTRTQIAQFCNRSESWVSLTLQLADLDPHYKKLMYSGRLSRTGAIAMILGTKKEYFDTVIETAKDIVRKEAEQEEHYAVNEEKKALADLEDAEIDAAIHEKRNDEVALANAKKRLNSARKRVSVASDKRQTARKKAEDGIITADTVTKVISAIPGAKKGKPKPLTAKTLREMHVKFTETTMGDDLRFEQRLAGRVALAMLEIVLGRRVPLDLNLLIDDVEKNLYSPPENLMEEQSNNDPPEDNLMEE